MLSESLGEEIFFVSGAFLEKCESIEVTHVFIWVMCSIECFADPVEFGLVSPSNDVEVLDEDADKEEVEVEVEKDDEGAFERLIRSICE